MLLLAVLARGPAHGYAIIEELKERSGGGLDLPEGTVYPALYRLERARLLRSRTATVSGRTRRLYELTGAGRAESREKQRLWDRMSKVIASVLEGAPRHAKA